MLLNISRLIPLSRYAEGATEYTTCAGLLTASSSAWPETALFQISANGVSLDKLVIGKPGTTADASNGYIDPSTLATCIAQAASEGWGEPRALSSSENGYSRVRVRCWCDGVAGKCRMRVAVALSLTACACAFLVP